MTETLTVAAARRIALAAQGYGEERPPRVNRGHLRRILERLSLHQIDSVNVVARAHYLPAFSRLGAYDRDLLDNAAWGRRSDRRLFEYWAHEASLLPLALHPLLRWRMAAADRGEIGWTSMRGFAREHRHMALAVLDRLRSDGPMAASDFEHGRSRSGWWEWGETKKALEWLFWAGHITTATRRGSFERVYDLTERVIPSAILDLPTPTEAEAHRALIDRGARALGVATATDLRDYFRLKPEAARSAVADLVDDGRLLPVRVAGWKVETYLHRDARRPRRIKGQALIAPFDPLIWERARTERLFGFRFRIEIYTPADRRIHGYYVLPFLMDDRLVARVDLKADRQRSRLLARQVTIEPDSPPGTLERLTDELHLVARWLELESVEIAGQARSTSATLS
ncbi:MAG TPA: crosslink repair DNA glycosylase YcaQ family protein [Allosphingosinicella sp.]|nr:crosslink repair DNA glycosylase YcaQ family protein [Allosphingosinicella sp.]